MKNTKSEIYQSYNNIKKYLLKFGEFKNIREAKSILGVDNANEVYELLLKGWNEFVVAENKIRMNKYDLEVKKYNAELKKYNDEQAKKLLEEVNKKARAVVQQKKEKKEKKEQIKLVIKEKKQKKVAEEKGLLDIQYTIRFEFIPRIKHNINGTTTAITIDNDAVKYPNKPIPNKQYDDTEGSTGKIWTKEKFKKESILVEIPNKLLSIDRIPYKNNNFVTIIGANILDKSKNPLYWKQIDEPQFKKTNDKNLIQKFYIENKIKKQKFFNDVYTICEILNYQFNKMDTEVLKKKKERSKVMMKKAFVLKNSWLRYAESIAKEAYENTKDECVYYQLEKFLLKPPAGNPTKFLNGKRINKEVLFNYFQNIQEEEEQETDTFNMKSGVNCEMLGQLCKDLKRNMYAYNEDDKCFFSVSCNDSKHYCPLSFYCMDGHFYLISDKEATKSIAESNKIKSKLIKSSLIEDKTEEKNREIIINHIDSFNVEKAKNYKNGCYMVQQSSINEEVIKFISFYKEKVLTTNRDNKIVKMVYSQDSKVSNNKVILLVDANYGKNMNYEQILNVAKNNNIVYNNQGIGSIIYKILQNALYTKYGTGDKEEEEEKKEEEKKNGSYNLNNFISSTFNDIVLNQIVKTNHFKSYQFVEKVELEQPVTNELNSYKIDINKCRRNILNYSNYEFPKYSIMDMPTEFKGEIKCGMYYVNTTNKYPFRMCGWYFEPLVKYGIDNNIITNENILYEFIPNATLKNDYFKEHIDILLKAFSCETALQKLAINSLIGVWGITKQSVCKTEFSICPYQASNWYYDEKNKNKNVFIKNHKIDEDTNLYEGLLNEEIINETTNYCLYSMILQMEAIELHKLESIIIKNGGIPIDRNTDAILYKAKNEINYKPYYFDDENKVAKYKYEVAKPLQVEKLKDYVRTDISKSFNFGLKWNIQYGYEGKTIEELVNDIITSNKSYNIDGMGGTGKTYLVNKITDELLKQNKKLIGVSPTNKGARLISGDTIHSYYYKFNRSKKMILQLLEKVDYIFIDEVSMMLEKFYTLFIMIKRALPNIKFIISGDFGQLPPVKDSWTGDYETSVGLWSLCDGNKIHLTDYKRGDKELFNLLVNIRKGDLSSVNVEDFKPTKETYLNIAYTHFTRRSVNKDCMERFLLEQKKPYIFIKQDSNNPKTQDVKLCETMPVIAHKTNKNLNIINSESYTITSIKDNKITMTNKRNDIINIEVKDFQKYFYLGFCITIYASQGETFNQPYTIYDWNFKHFCNKAKYVALSRATNIKNIQIFSLGNEEMDFDDFNNDDVYYQGDEAFADDDMDMDMDLLNY